MWIIFTGIDRLAREILHLNRQTIRIRYRLNSFQLAFLQDFRCRKEELPVPVFGCLRA